MDLIIYNDSSVYEVLWCCCYNTHKKGAFWEQNYDTRSYFLEHKTRSKYFIRYDETLRGKPNLI